MKMNLSQFLTVVNGSDKIKVFDTLTFETLYEGTASECPCLYVEVYCVYASNGILKIEVV